ncbi:endonuclease III, partial [Lacticaseibacillus rhamnosus]
DTYAMRLFNRLGFGPYKNYAKMQADFTPLLTGISLDDAREWHALIDEHGKTQVRHAYDDHFLLQPNLPEAAWPPEAKQIEPPHDDPGSGKWRRMSEQSDK